MTQEFHENIIFKNIQFYERYSLLTLSKYQLSYTGSRHGNGKLSARLQ